MRATPNDDIRLQTFRDALLGAVVEGQNPSPSCDLGPESRSIIQAIADGHPEANPDLIGDAYDAFDREHNGDGWRFTRSASNC